jgi:hypothetical protein
MNAHRAKSWLIAILSLALVLLANQVILAWVGFDLASFTILFLVPVGALILCLLASTGFYVGIRMFPFQPNSVDLVFLMLLNVSAVLLVYAVEYCFAQAQHPESFSQFFVHSITESKFHMYMRRMPTDAPPVAAQEAGWLLLLIRLSAALAVAKIIHSRFDHRTKEQWGK